MDNNKKIEQMVLTCIDTAKAMLDEYEIVIPFGIRCYTNSEDMKMSCPGDNKPDTNWNEQIDMVVNELKAFVSNEAIFATALVTELQSDELAGLGLQIETQLSSVLFVYPFKKVDDDWVIDEPVKTDQLLNTVF